jgi:Flp pilus assembly protein TadB
MKDFDALKDIWHGQLAEPKLSYDDILKGVRSSKSSFANKLLFEALAILAAILLFVFIWISNPHMMLTTHLALFIFIACCIYYLVVQIRDYKSISNSEHLLKQPEEYIGYLKAYRRKRYVLNTRKYTVYSTFIGIGFALYFVDVYINSPLWQTISGIVATMIWFVVCWYLMKSYIRKEQDKLNEMIVQLERLEKQFGDAT